MRPQPLLLSRYTVLKQVQTYYLSSHTPGAEAVLMLLIVVIQLIGYRLVCYAAHMLVWPPHHTLHQSSHLRLDQSSDGTCDGEAAKHVSSMLDKACVSELHSVSHSCLTGLRQALLLTVWLYL